MEITSFLWHVVIATLSIFLAISTFIYKNIKENVFKFYALFKFFLLVYLILKSNIIIDISLPKFEYLSPLNWGIQVLYNVYLSYFGISFLKLHDYYAKTINHIHNVLKKTLIISSVFCIFTIIFNASNIYFYFFSFIYLPFQLFLSFYILYLAKKAAIKERIYYFIGIISYILFACIAFSLTITQKFHLDILTPISFFYIGILIEEYSFGYGLSEKIKKMYYDKLFTEQQLTLAQKKVNKHLQNEVDKIKIEKQIKDLKFIVMSSKMNSHFIFNTLNSIKHYIITDDKENAINYLGKFSSFIRNILEIDPTKMISLEKELANTKLYVDLENMRFNDDIKFNIVIPNTVDIDNTKIPPFVLQPFIENAIWHGIASKTNKAILLTIELKQNSLLINITDNGIGRKKAHHITLKRDTYKKSMGIEITKNILKNFYNNQFSIHFIDLYKDKKPLGTKVILQIPK